MNEEIEAACHLGLAQTGFSRIPLNLLLTDTIHIKTKEIASSSAVAGSVLISMMSRIISLLLLLGIICAALIAGHPHDPIEDPEGTNDALEESGSGYNSAEEFMNAMDELIRRWQENDAAHENSTDYPSLDDDETTLDFMDITTEPAT